MIGLLYIFIGAVLIVFLYNIPMSWISQREETLDDIEDIKKGLKYKKHKKYKKEHESWY
jgi:hypothetical protein